MADKRDRYYQAAEDLYVEVGRTLRQIEQRLPVSHTTLGEWCKTGNWVTKRKTRRISRQTIIGKIEAAIDEMLSNREIDSKVTDAVAKLEKSLDRYKKESGERFVDTAILVMDRFIEHIQHKYSDPEQRQGFMDEIDDFFGTMEAEETRA